MRIIAGTYRSRLLVSPPGTLTRPTSDRLRETLFNILAPQIEGSQFVDLYAGTGAVGLEAISRGAAQTWFAENGPPAIKALKANLQALKITSGYTLEDRGTGALLQRLVRLTTPIDVVFLDPPYDAETEYSGTLGFLGSQTAAKLFHAGTVVVAEHSTRAKFKLAERYGQLSLSRGYKQGDSSLAFYGLGNG